MNFNQVIIAPIITEKSMKDVKIGKFTFKVSKNADKRLIKNAIEKMFKVDVLKTYVSVVKGKRAKVGIRRLEILVSPWKKAIVKLAKDQKIGLFEQGEKK